ncbi:MAG: protein translocase SEC61 complex subunit gamma [DPANN group archaeon]|nr:protein translocase SEC61 complex subunit gamma [DPANN group archaeon]
MSIKNKLKDFKRVLNITKKPSKAELSMSIKITGIGILLIGLVGFVIYIFAMITGIF